MRFRKKSTFNITDERVNSQMKIDWKAKLTSRKFWAAVIGFVTTLLIAFNVSDLQIEQTIAAISAASVLIAYIIGEGLVDAARVKESEDKNNESS